MIKHELFQNIDTKLLSKFKQYHLKNPDVYTAFKKYAFAMKETGKKKYSAWIIINRIRWEHDLYNKEPFKINNDYIALYARLLVYHYPLYKEFFEFRTMKAFDRRDSREEIYRKNTIN